MDNEHASYTERQASRAREMLQRLDVDPVKLTKLDNGKAFADVRSKCLACQDARECIHWLDALPPHTEPPSFCPNVELYKACNRDLPLAE